MVDQPTISVRYSLRELENDADPNMVKKRRDFLKALHLLQKVPHTNPNSWWAIASYHGMPYKERIVDKDYKGTSWGGYCQHANVLFPAWHRWQLWRLEQALKTVYPEGDIAVPYWDETSKKSLIEGIPKLLLQETVEIDDKGTKVDNPLRSYTLQAAVGGGSIDPQYQKPAGYTTRRYPFSGICYPPEAKKKADEQNEKILLGNETPDSLLQKNVLYWLHNGQPNAQKLEELEKLNTSEPYITDPNSVYYEYYDCLRQKYFNTFSNTFSSGDADSLYYGPSLENAHNNIHLAMGGWDEKQITPGSPIPNMGLVEGANGDMGENETAAFDPAFFMHHCNVDRLFWIWQKKWGFTKREKPYTIHADDPGAKVNSGQGPTPNQNLDQALTMNTILYPFQDSLGVPRDSTDCIDISELGYDYSIGSLDQATWPAPPSYRIRKTTVKPKTLEECKTELSKAISADKEGDELSIINFNMSPYRKSSWDFLKIFKKDHYGGAKWDVRQVVAVSNINKNAIKGSFSITCYTKDAAGNLSRVSNQGVLNRWNPTKCANCKERPTTTLSFKLNNAKEYLPADIQLTLETKDPTTKKPKFENLDPKSFSDDSKPKVNFYFICTEDIHED